MSRSETTQYISLGIDEIIVGERLRIASPSGVDSLVESIREIGKIMHPITVQKVKNEYRLIDGLNRLEAARVVGFSDVPVAVERCTNAQALRMEVDANTAGSPLDALDMAVFLAARKKLYEKEHPERKHGIAGAKARWDAVDSVAIASFITNAAATFGRSERTIYRLISLGERLPSEGVAYLRQSNLHVRVDDLNEIAKLGDPEEMITICKSLADGTAKTAKQALKACKAPGAAVKDPLEEDLKRLNDAFRRSSNKAKIQFVSERYEVLHLLMGVAEAKRDAGPAEVIPFKVHDRG